MTEDPDKPVVTASNWDLGPLEARIIAHMGGADLGLVHLGLDYGLGNADLLMRSMFTPAEGTRTGRLELAPYQKAIVTSPEFRRRSYSRWVPRANKTHKIKGAR